MDTTDILFKEGSVVLEERPFAWEFFPDYRKVTCHRCCGQGSSRCSGCKWTFYCGKTCQKTDWNERHKLECGLLKQAAEDFKPMEGETARITLAVLLRKAILHIKREGPNSDFYKLAVDLSLPSMWLNVNDPKGIPTRIIDLFTGPLAYSFNLCAIRALDPEGSVCADEEAYKLLFARMEKNTVALYGLPPGRATCLVAPPVVGMTVSVTPLPVQKTCEANIFDTNPFVPDPTKGPKNNAAPVPFMALRDIKIGEPLSRATYHFAYKLCTKAQRLDILKTDRTICACRACVDPAVEAARLSLKCSNESCTRAIPSDSRAEQPCPGCGSVNTARLAEALPVLQRIDEFYPIPWETVVQRHMRQGPLKVIDALIADGQRVLHPTNVLMGMLHLDASRHLAAQHQAHCQPKSPYAGAWLEHTTKMLTCLEVHGNKFESTVRTNTAMVCHMYAVKKLFDKAMPFAKNLLDRGRVNPGVGSRVDQLATAIWNGLNRQPKPRVDSILFVKLAGMGIEEDSDDE